MTGKTSLREIIKEDTSKKFLWVCKEQLEEKGGQAGKESSTKLIKGPRIHQFSQDAKRTSIQQVLWSKKNCSSSPQQQNEEISIGIAPPSSTKKPKCFVLQRVMLETDNYRKA